VIETKKVSDVASQVPVILRALSLGHYNSLIYYTNDMMRLSFGNLTLELNIFNIQRQPSGFDDMAFFTLNWREDSEFDDDFDDIFASEFEPFLMDDESEHDVFEFDDLYSTAKCLLASVAESLSKNVLTPALELKPPPDSLKYAFLGHGEFLPNIIAYDLDQGQEDKFIALLRENKEAIVWTLGDVKRISPSIVQHRIHLENNAKPHRDRQRHLNPTLSEVIRKEVLKWLDHTIIYPICDSEWFNPVEVVPKETGIIMIKNNKN